MAGSTRVTRHNPWYIALVIYNIITFIAVVVFSVLNSFESNGGVFLTTPKKQSRKYPLDISTPVEWTQIIWWVVYAWQGLWLLYSFVNIFRRKNHHHHQDHHNHNNDNNDDSLYYYYSSASPFYLLLIPPPLLGVYVVANGANVFWRFLLDGGYLGAGLGVSLLTSVLLWISLALSYRSLRQAHVSRLSHLQRGCCCGCVGEVWLVRVLVHNGIGLYAGWASFASLPLQLATVLAYRDDVVRSDDVSSVMTSSTIALGVLAVFMGAFYLLDLASGVWDRYSRYTLTPYVAVTVGLLGMAFDRWDLGHRNAVFVFILCVLACVFLVLKALVMIVRHARERS